MSKVSEQFHKKYHAHHQEKAEIHAEHAEAHKSMMDHHDDGPEHAFHKRKHELHKAASETHATLRDYHKVCMEKAASDELKKTDTAPASLENLVRSILVKMLGDTLMSTNISAVAPNAPGFRAVPRGGQPPVKKPDVPLEFQKLVAVDEQEEQPGLM